MKTWLRRIRGTILMGLTWAALWAPVGPLIGMVVDADGSMDEPWVVVGVYPGFLGGVAFATVLGIVGRRRRFGELSLPRFAAWGAAAGLLLGALWLVVVVSSDPPRWVLNAVVVGALTFLSGVSAAGSLALARMAEKGDLPDTGSDVVEAGLTDGEARELLGPGTRRSTRNQPAAAERAARR